MIAYLDTSALVKLYIREPDSAQVRKAAVDADTLATSQITYVEARAAAARRVRERSLSREAQARFSSDLEADWKHYAVVEVSRTLCRFGADLAEQHPLRGGDAIQLASALSIRAESSEPVLFLCFDERLRLAARAEGLLTDL